jgi:hypothetical protein
MSRQPTDRRGATAIITSVSEALAPRDRECGS